MGASGAGVHGGRCVAVAAAGFFRGKRTTKERAAFFFFRRGASRPPASLLFLVDLLPTPDTSPPDLRLSSSVLICCNRSHRFEDEKRLVFLQWSLARTSGVSRAATAAKNNKADWPSLFFKKIVVVRV
jgi:hypothetical protein